MDIDWWGLKYEQVNPQLICPICQVALVQPVVTPCGHTFCKKCLDSLAESNSHSDPDSGSGSGLKCPVDRSLVDPEAIQPAPFLVSGLVNDLIVHCPHSKCTFKDKRWLLQSHLDLHCEFTPIDCSCGQQKERHWNECPHVEAECPNGCENLNLKLLELNDHLAQCPSEPWDCPHCDDQFVAGDRQEHVAQCSKWPEACPGPGCPFQGPKQELAEHTVGCALALIAPILSEQSAKIASLERESQTLKRELDNTKRQAKRDAASLDKHILVEYDRMRTDLDYAIVHNDGTMKQMMMLGRENIQIVEDVGFLKSAVNSLRHQLHHLINTRRFYESEAHVKL